MTCDIRVGTSGFHYKHFGASIPERLESLLQSLPRDVRYAFEFRERAWMTPQVDSIVKKFNAAFCIYELAGYHSPLNITADFGTSAVTVLRSASTREATAKNYSEERLRAWARQIETWAAKLKAVYVYFDNDQAGCAAANALTLKSMVSERGSRRLLNEGRPVPSRVGYFTAP
jgi:uncharacterized protein YecE (DUF72 family)